MLHSDHCEQNKDVKEILNIEPSRGKFLFQVNLFTLNILSSCDISIHSFLIQFRNLWPDDNKLNNQDQCQISSSSDLLIFPPVFSLLTSTGQLWRPLVCWWLQPVPSHCEVRIRTEKHLQHRRPLELCVLLSVPADSRLGYVDTRNEMCEHPYTTTLCKHPWQVKML